VNLLGAARGVKLKSLEAFGPTTTLLIGALAIDFFLLFMSNRIFQNILRETNYASKSLEAKHKDPATWKLVSMEELKAFFGLLITMSLHKLPAS